MTRDDMVKKFADSIEKERVRIGLSQKQMASKLNISLATYKRIITCEVEKIDLYLAYRLYLLTGKLAYQFLNYNDSHLDVKSKIKDLTSSQLAFIDGVVDFEKQFANTHENFEDYISVYVPTGNMEDGMIYDASSIEKVNVAEYKKKYPNLINCGIRITSDHMKPAYNRGDILLICRNPIRDGDTGIFVNKENGCAYIRKFLQGDPCKLEPVTNFGETICVEKDCLNDITKWIQFGYVLSKVR